VALILDVMGLTKRAELVTETTTAAATTTTATAAQENLGGTMLVFATDSNPRMAIPLARVARLEELPSDKVETSGGRKVTQYRGGIMPLISLDEILPGPGASVENTSMPAMLQVIVHIANGRNYGIVVKEVSDIVEARVDLEGGGARVGVLGSAVIAGKVTELLDVSAVVQRAMEISKPVVGAADAETPTSEAADAAKEMSHV
jgi:two-component system chemotaxis sensor kinase CheA